MSADDTDISIIYGDGIGEIIDDIIQITPFNKQSHDYIQRDIMFCNYCGLEFNSESSTKTETGSDYDDEDLCANGEIRYTYSCSHMYHINCLKRVVIGYAVTKYNQYEIHYNKKKIQFDNCPLCNELNKYNYIHENYEPVVSYFIIPERIGGRRLKPYFREEGAEIERIKNLQPGTIIDFLGFRFDNVYLVDFDKTLTKCDGIIPLKFLKKNGFKFYQNGPFKNEYMYLSLTDRESVCVYDGTFYFSNDIGNIYVYDDDCECEYEYDCKCSRSCECECETDCSCACGCKRIYEPNCKCKKGYYIINENNCEEKLNTITLNSNEYYVVPIIYPMKYKTYKYYKKLNMKNIAVEVNTDKPEYLTFDIFLS